jgi:phosphate transport system substrate-binding protein
MRILSISTPRIQLAALALGMSMLLSACGGGSSNAGERQASGDQAEAEDQSSDDGQKTTVVIKGSDTAEELVKALSKAFMEQNKEVTIKVAGGGSGLGITALIDANADIANASRPMKTSEIDRAKGNNIDPREFVIAEDGLAVVVHADNPLEGLDMEQLGGLYRGEITDWEAVGGPAAPVQLYSRDISSGTYVYFRDNAVKGDYADNTQLKGGNEEIVEAVMQDPQGIGYVGLGYALTEDGQVREGIKVLSIAKDPDSKPASPMDAKNITTGDYPLARPLYQYINGKPQGLIANFLAFEISDQAKSIIKEVGFYPPTEKHMQQNMELVGSAM